MSVISAVSNNIKNVVIPFWAEKMPEMETVSKTASTYLPILLSPGLVLLGIAGCAQPENKNGPAADKLEDDGEPLDPGNGAPTDEDGDVVLPDDWGDGFWQPLSEDSGRFFMISDWIPFTHSKIQDPNLHNLQLYYSFMSDTTLINGMPAEGSFPYMVNNNRVEEGFPGCPKAGYEDFASCPDEPQNGLPYWLAGYQLADQEPVYYIDPNDSTAIDALFTDPEAYTEYILGQAGAGEEDKITVNIPKDLYINDIYQPSVALQFIVDDRQVSEFSSYLAPIGVTIKAR